MQLARVIGTVVATQKNAKLEGAKLLLVQPVTPDDQPRGPAVLAIDSVGAGIGEKVLIVLEGRAAGEALRRKAAPVDAAIVGIVDCIDWPRDERTAEAGSEDPAPPGKPRRLTADSASRDTKGHARRRAPRARS